MVITESDKKRFWAKVRKTEGCWLWVGATKTGGYGQITVDGRSRGAHVVSYSIEKGSIPDQLFVLHECDTANCVNPQHLFLGTQADNMKDKVKKGRQAKGSELNHPDKKGSLNPSAKLSEDKVEEIKRLRQSGEYSLRQLGKLYGVSHRTIIRVLNGKGWAHV